MAKTKLMHIGIISPRTYSVDGYDCDNPIRSSLSYTIEQILLFYKNKSDILGVTSLSQGADQDFANVCIQNNIKYMVCLPYENQESLWVTGISEYKKLLDSAYDIEPLSSGNYSPRKIITKNKFIHNKCDVIIYIENKLKNKCPILQKILLDQKPVYILRARG